MSLSDIISSKHPVRTGLIIWAIGWMLMLFFGHTLELETLCAIAILIAVLGAMTLNFTSSVVFATLTTLAINWLFIPPQGSFIIDLQMHATLLIAQWTVSIAVPGFIVMQRNYSAWLNKNLQRLIQIESELKRLQKNHANLSPRTLHDFLSIVAEGSASLQIINESINPNNPQAEHCYLGTPTFEEKIVMGIIRLQGSAFGPLTGSNENLDCWYFPLKRDGKLIGVAHIALKDHEHDVLLVKKYAAVLSALQCFDQHGQLE